MEYGVHIPLFVEGIENGTGDIRHALSDNPDEGSGRYRIYQRLEGYQHTQSHAHKAEGLDVRMLLQPDEADDGSRDGTHPYEAEQRPAPIALGAQRHQRQWRVRARYVPVDGGMVPLAQPLLPLRPAGQRVVYRRGHIRAQHAEQIETHAQSCPGVMALESHHDEYHPEDDTHHDASGVRP